MGSTIVSICSGFGCAELDPNPGDAARAAQHRLRRAAVPATAAGAGKEPDVSATFEHLGAIHHDRSLSSLWPRRPSPSVGKGKDEEATPRLGF